MRDFLVRLAAIQFVIALTVFIIAGCIQNLIRVLGVSVGYCLLQFWKGYYEAKKEYLVQLSKLDVVDHDEPTLRKGKFQ